MSQEKVNEKDLEVVEDTAKEAAQPLPLEPNAEEQQILAEMRLRKQKQLDCEKEVVEVLKRYGGVLYVDLNSPIGNPIIAIQIQ